MKTSEIPAGIFPDDIKAELQKALENTKGGITDSQAAKKACERMDRIREENRALFGETDIAVELIRQARDREPDQHALGALPKLCSTKKPG